MKKLLVVALVISLISSFFMILYFLISTDIYHDYVSTKALASLNIVENMEKLPVWAVGESLWKGMQLDLVIRIVCMIFILIVMLQLIDKLGTVSLIVMFLLIFISFVSLFFYFLASSDIYHDYISKRALITSNLNYLVVLKYDVKELPVWTECRGEWSILQWDLYIRLIFMIFTITTLLRLIRKYMGQSPTPSAV